MGTSVFPISLSVLAYDEKRPIGNALPEGGMSLPGIAPQDEPDWRSCGANERKMG